MRSLLRLPLALVIALAAMTGAHAQNKPRQDSTVIPVWNKGSGKVEALLYLEPTGEQAVGARWHFGRSSLDAAFGLSSGDSLGLLCNSSRGTSISGLASHCMLASLGDDDENTSLSRRVSGTAAFNRPGGRLGITAGTGRDTLPAWLAGPNKSPALRAEQNDLTVFGRKNIGREGFVSIGGTYAKARLVPLSDASPAIVDRWDSKSLTIGAGYGNFSGNIIGRVVDVPGQPGKWEGLGVGLTWRTPWSGQLTVGAENVITRGKNPFAPRNESTDEGTVPYVRYEQDL
ncbi:XOO1806 family protein [Stenotrophomonas rhizophila]